MDLAQTKIVGLTMELDLKAKEFKMLCEKLEEAKKRTTDPNDERLLWFKELFERNNKEITEINKQLKELQDAEIDKQESFNPRKTATRAQLATVLSRMINKAY